MELTVLKQEEKAIMKIRGDIDEGGAAELKRRFHELDSSVKKAVFDFGGVTYIGSAGIGKLLLFYKDMAARGGTISVVNAAGSIYDLLRELKLDRQLDRTPQGQVVALQKSST